MIAHNCGVGKLVTLAARVGTFLLCLIANCQATAEQAPALALPLEEEPKVTLSDFLRTVDQHNWYTSFAFTIGTTILTLGLGLGGALLFKNVRELKAEMRLEIDNAKKTIERATELLGEKAAEVDTLKKDLQDAKTVLERELRQYTGVGLCFITSELGVVLHKLSQTDLSTSVAIQEALKPHGERFLSWTLQRASQTKTLFTHRAEELPLLAMLAVYEGIAHKRLGRTARALQVLEQERS